VRGGLAGCGGGGGGGVPAPCPPAERGNEPVAVPSRKAIFVGRRQWFASRREPCQNADRM